MSRIFKLSWVEQHFYNLWPWINWIYTLTCYSLWSQYLGVQTVHVLFILTHLCGMELTTRIYWTSPFPFLRLLVGIFHFDSNFNRTLSGWVVTWFLLGYTVRMFEYIVRTFWSNVGRFLYVFSSILRKLYTIFQPTFSPIKRYQDSVFKLFTLSTNSDKCCPYSLFPNSGPIFAAKDFVTESVLKVRSFMRIFWHR